MVEYSLQIIAESMPNFDFYNSVNSCKNSVPW